MKLKIYKVTINKIIKCNEQGGRNHCECIVFDWSTVPGGANKVTMIHAYCTHHFVQIWTFN